MILSELIETLAKYPSDLVVPNGFHEPHSYRGFYEELAFEPAQNVTVGAMLKAARKCVGRTFTGYKGGEFTMHNYTSVYLAEWGDTGEELGPRLLAYMLKEAEHGN